MRKSKLSEPTYTIKELENSKRFNYPKVLVRAALKQSKQKEFTLNDAKQIIEDFANMEVL